MAKLESLLTRVLDEIPTVPRALALRALADATKEFCTRTHAWRQTLMPHTVRAGSPVVELMPDQGTMIVAVKEVRSLGQRIEPVPVEALDLQMSQSSAGPAIRFTQISPDVIHLGRTPTEDASLSITAALTLVLGNTTVNLPDHLIDEHGEAIAHGAKMRLVRQVNQPWADAPLAAMYAVQYYSQITAAKSRTFDALGEAAVRVHAPRW